MSITGEVKDVWIIWISGGWGEGCDCSQWGAGFCIAFSPRRKEKAHLSLRIGVICTNYTTITLKWLNGVPMLVLWVIMKVYTKKANLTTLPI